MTEGIEHEFEDFFFSTFLSSCGGLLRLLCCRAAPARDRFHLGLNDSASGEAEILQRLTFLDQFRAVALLLGFSFIPILAAYAAVALRRYPLRPAGSLLGSAFSLLFVGSEAGVRSIDLFLVSKKWAAAYQATTAKPPHDPPTSFSAWATMYAKGSVCARVKAT